MFKSIRKFINAFLFLYTFIQAIRGHLDLVRMFAHEVKRRWLARRKLINVIPLYK
jgi:hypothetical protein